MDIQELKERIILDEKIEDILNELGMGHIKEYKDYFSCSMPDGDNRKSTIIYKNSLHVDAYTRNIQDQYGNSDIISLVTFVKGTYFTDSIKWICDVCGYDFYGQKNEGSRLAKWVREIYKSSSNDNDEDEELKPINEEILKYFGRYANRLFCKDGINENTQWEFELGYDLMHHMITIPIRDELGSLVGIKGRLFKEQIEPWEDKYFYIYPCSKTKILYGLHKSKKYIKEKNEVIVCESEKGVMQLWSMGIKHAVAIGGHKLSKAQVQKLTHLGVPIVLAFDEGAELGKDGKVDRDYYRNEFNKFLPQQKLYVIYDKSKKILCPKESPMDNPEKWNELYKKKYRVR